MNKGFTLIELSIVLIIISLIVASITSGKALIKQSELHSITSDVQKYKTVFNTFRLSYNALPGDMVDGFAYWGGTGTCTVNNPSADINGCNGNDDNVIASGTGVGPQANGVDEHRVWLHLSLAELIPGEYTGFPSAGGGNNPGVNVPTSKYDGGYFRARWTGTPIYQARSGNFINYGGVYLTAKEARSIDNKVDDGVADKGEVVSYSVIGGGGPFGCVDAAWSSATGASYQLDDTSQTCGVAFYIDRN